MVAHGVSRGGAATGSHSPEGDTLKKSKVDRSVALRAYVVPVPLNPRLTLWATICRPPG